MLQRPGKARVDIEKAVGAGYNGAKKRAAPKRCPFASAGSGRGIDARKLGDVVPERGPDHVVDALGTLAHAGDASGDVEGIAGPSDFLQIGIGNAPLDAPLRTVVDLVPEAHGTLHDLVDVAVARTRAGRTRGSRTRRKYGVRGAGSWKPFCGATGVVEERRAIAHRNGLPCRRRRS